MSKDIPMEKCDSSQVEAFGYDDESQTLAVKFNRGGLYHCHNVGPQVFAAMKSTESVGKFVGTALRGKFEFTKIQ